jgi:triacylglycerol lipase
MLGDYLQRRGNELAIVMSFRHDGKLLELTEAGLRAAHAALSPKLCVLVHGLCCNESVWRLPEVGHAKGGTYGTRLHRDAGHTPFAIRYNTGLSIAQGSAQLAHMLGRLAAAYPVPIDEITLIGHSMGGLVIRGACDAAHEGSNRWLSRVKRVIYIGTPHDGADLERVAHFAAGTLQAIPNPVTRLLGDILDLRSRGTKDLHSAKPLSTNEPLPWLASARHYMLMGTITRNPAHPVSRIFGDALVRVPGPKRARTGKGSVPEVTVFPGVHHLALAHDESVYRRIRQICAGN